MSNKVNIMSVMTPCPHSIGLTQPASLARELMRKYGIRHLPVRSGGALLGIVSDRDIKFAMSYAKDTEGTMNIEDIYTPEPYIVAPETPLADVAKRMADDKLGCALVVDHGDLVGIFTTTDACRVLAENV